jgi:hypothetical protein
MSDRSHLTLVTGKPDSDSQAGVVEFEINAWTQRNADGTVTTHVEFEGPRDKREAAAFLKLTAAHMDDREAEVVFQVVMGLDPEPKDPDFPYRWQSDFFVCEPDDPKYKALCGTDLTERLRILRRVIASYEADLADG